MVWSKLYEGIIFIIKSSEGINPKVNEIFINGGVKTLGFLDIFGEFFSSAVSFSLFGY